jgi:hypothetical protein
MFKFNDSIEEMRDDHLSNQWRNLVGGARMKPRAEIGDAPILAGEIEVVWILVDVGAGRGGQHHKDPIALTRTLSRHPTAPGDEPPGGSGLVDHNAALLERHRQGDLAACTSPSVRHHVPIARAACCR